VRNLARWRAMRRSIQQPNAIERARAAYELMMRRRRAATAARRQRERARFIAIVSVLVGVLALAVGTVIYNGWVPSWRSSVETARVDNDFVRTRTGQVRSFVKGDICRDLQFSNDTGGYVGGAFVPCETVARPDPATASAKAERLNSIRGAFSTR
jgi:hypothetical protein